MKRYIFLLLFAIAQITTVQAQQWTTFNSANSGLITDDITSITIDPSGNLWVGADHGGITKYDGTTWTNYNTLNSGIPSNRVVSVFAASNGDIWVSTYSGFTQFNGTTWTNHLSSLDVPENFNEDPLGNIWTAGGSKVNMYNGSNWTTYWGTSIDFPGTAYDIVFNSIGDAWIATSEGLTKFDGTWTNINPSNSNIPQSVIVDLEIDNADNIWCATYDSGICKYNGSSFTIYNTTNSSIPDNSTRAIKLETNSIIWVGTRYGGLSKFDGTNWETFNTSNSNIPGNYVVAIEINNDKDKWVGTLLGDGLGLLESPIGIDDVNSWNYIENIYPNPTSHQLTIDTELEISEISVIDVTGKTVKTSKQNTNTINVDDLSNGIYFIKFITNENTIIKKFLKE